MADPTSDSRRRPDLVTVIMPARNAANTIDEALDALVAQDYRGSWEVLVVDNGSTDTTRSVVRSFLNRLPGLRIVSAPDQQGVSYARNTGLAAARGDFVAICDADDAAEPQWLTSLVRAAAEYDLVGGYCDRTALNAPRIDRTTPPSERRLPEGLGHLRFALGGNMGVWRSVAQAVGGWDEQFTRGCEDVDFSWRVQQAGFSIGMAEEAVIQIRLRSDGKTAVRQGFNWGRSDARLYARHRAHGATRLSSYRWLRAVGGLASLGIRYHILPSPQRLDWWYQIGRRGGRLVGSVENRVWFP